MKKLLKLSAAVFSLIASANAFSAEWNFVWVGNEDTRYFFDSETVEKSRDKNVILWVKTVQTTKPDSDGSWASALRWKMNCTKRTIQTLAMSIYDNEGKFIRSYPSKGTENDVIPDSAGEGMFKIACDPNFPNDKSEKYYFKITGIDVFQATKNYIEMKKSQIDSAPK